MKAMQEYEEQVIQSRKPGNWQRVGKYKILYDKLARIHIKNKVVEIIRLILCIIGM